MKLVKPRGATHARIVTPNRKKATASVQDLDVFKGTAGTITWLKIIRGGDCKELGSIQFDGKIET